MTASRKRVHVLSMEVQLELYLTPPPRDEPASAKVIALRPSKTDQAPPESEEPPWSDDDIYQLRKGLLHDSLHQLADRRTSAATRREIQDWVESHAIEPFSFTVCARECGYNEKDLRERLDWLLCRVWR